MKILRKILSSNARRFGERVEQSRAKSAEQLKQERERNAALLRPDGSSDVQSAEGQQGRRLPRGELVRRLQKLNPAILYEQSIRYPDQGGLYVMDKASPYGKRLLCGLPHGVVNEFSTVLTKPSLIPDLTIAQHWQKIQQVDSRIPGWRTILYRLLVEQLVTMGQVEKEFKISEGRSSQFWQQSVN